MSLFPLNRLARRLITHGQLTVVDVDGASETFGKAGTGPSVTLRIRDPRLVRRLLVNPTLVVGEAYVDGSYTLEAGTLRDFLEIMLVSSEGHEPRRFGILLQMASSMRRNRGDRAARNVQHHYDIDHRLYERFLDEDMQYSCAYWRDGVTSLEEAQLDKKRYIAAKLLLRPGMKVLDIGSGWGGMALYLAREHGVEVTGVTLSLDQYQTSVRRAQEAGLSDRVTFKLQDYRHETGSYDRIVSVGMFEHVGVRGFAEYFAHLDRLLKSDGVALLHTIGRMTTPGPINAWVLKYIFPGAYLPSLSQLAPIIERQGLWLADFEMLRIHYAKTLAAWDERFQARRAEVAAMFDERFCRMWEFYLQVCELSFRHRPLAVFQMQFAKEIGIVPITRDYIYPGQAVATDAKPMREGAAANEVRPRKRAGERVAAKRGTRVARTATVAN